MKPNSAAAPVFRFISVVALEICESGVALDIVEGEV